MASGQTLASFKAFDTELPTSNYAQLDTRNSRPVLAFDTTTQEAACFSGLLPRSYNGGGITVYVTWMAASATTGTIGWTVEFERVSDGASDADSDGFASAQTITAATVPGTAGVPSTTNVAVTDGANIDSLAVGDWFRIRIKRDVANDTATGDAHLAVVELKET